MRSRWLAAASGLVALSASLLVGPGASGQAGPAPHFDLVVTPTSVEAGSDIDLSGYCRPGGSPANPHIRIYWAVIPGAAPYQAAAFSPDVDGTGAFQTSATIPSSAPSGSYVVSLGCSHGDVSYGGADVEITVSGGTDPVITTTSTTSTSTPPTLATIPPVQVAPVPVPAAPPADAVQGAANFTG